MERIIMILTLLAAACSATGAFPSGVSGPTGAAETAAMTDSASTTTGHGLCEAERPTWVKVAVPVALTGLGAWGTRAGWLRSIDNSARRDMMRLRGDHHAVGVDNYARFFPAAAYLALGYVPGIQCRLSLAERAMTTATAYVLMGVAVKGMKLTFRERRPDGNGHDSFPSGHTAAAFVGAELLRLEYGTWPGVAGYGVAAGVAFLRLYNDRHWLTDVVGGAGVGILCANAAYWLLPLERRLIGMPSSASVAVAPAYLPSARAMALRLTATF